MEALDYRRILARYAVAVGLGAVSRRDTCGIEEIFGSPGNSVQRTAVSAGGDLTVGLPRLSQGELFGEGDDAAQSLVVVGDARQINSRQLLGSQPTRPQPLRQLPDRRERDVSLARGKWPGASCAAYEARRRRRRLSSGKGGIP